MSRTAKSLCLIVTVALVVCFVYLKNRSSQIAEIQEATQELTEEEKEYMAHMQEHQREMESMQIEMDEELAKAPFVFPEFIFEEPKGDNALITTARIETQEEPIWQTKQYLKRFGGSWCKYDGSESTLVVARTQEDFEKIMKTMITDREYVLPRELNFEEELFLFVFNGSKKDANEFTLVEVSEVDREGPIEMGDKGKDLGIKQFDSILVRVEIQIGKPGLTREGFSPWTMYRVDKKKLFKDAPMTKDTHFVFMESRSNNYSKKETLLE